MRTTPDTCPGFFVDLAGGSISIYRTKNTYDQPVDHTNFSPVNARSDPVRRDVKTGKNRPKAVEMVDPTGLEPVTKRL